MLPELFRDINFKYMTSFCKTKEKIDPKERFTHGCMIYKCTKYGLQIVEESKYETNLHRMKINILKHI